VCSTDGDPSERHGHGALPVQYDTIAAGLAVGDYTDS
jgi:hypothetical protein